MTKTLAQEHQLVNLTRVGAEWEITSQLGSWRKLGAGQFCSSKYFDLAGMSMDEKTLFFEAAGVQTTLAPLANNTNTGDSAIIMDIMSTVPLTDQ